MAIDLRGRREFDAEELQASLLHRLQDHHVVKMQVEGDTKALSEHLGAKHVIEVRVSGYCRNDFKPVTLDRSDYVFRLISRIDHNNLVG
jgi:hypothetical protein